MSKTAPTSRSRRINSRQKGAQGEREFAAELRKIFGCSARRGQQFSGSPDSPDVVTSIKGVHFEVKRVEALQLYAALDQSIRDAGTNEIPVVAHRKNRRDWVVVVRLDDVPKFAKTLIDNDCLNK